MKYRMKNLSAVLAGILLVISLALPAAWADSFETDTPSAEAGHEDILPEDKDEKQPVEEQENSEDPDETIVEDEDTTEKKISLQRPNEFAILSQLGIVKEDLEAQQIVTRGEFAELVCHLVGLGKSYDVRFSDVTKDTPHGLYIQMIAKSGVMIGFNDGTFRPDEEITYTQALSVILKIAGYDYFVNRAGGYPNGTVKIAAEQSLTGHYPLEKGLTWDSTVFLIYKSLFLNVMSVEASSMGGLTVTGSEKTILEKFFGLVKAEGLVAANSDIALSGRNRTIKGYVTVSSENNEWLLAAGDSGIEEYVGYRVYYYVDEDNEIFCFEVRETKMQTLEVYEKNFISIDRGLTRLDYVQGDVERGKTAKIASNADFVYNGTSCYEVTADDFEKADSIRLIDYNNDGVYELVHVMVCDVYFVDKISAKTGIVTDKRVGTFLQIDIDQNDFDVVFMKGGMKTDISIISEWDVLSVAISRNTGGKQKMTIIITSNIVVGEINSVFADDREVVINGRAYPVSNKIDIEKLNRQETATFGMNEYGMLVCYKREVTLGKQYAYLIRVFAEIGEKDYDFSLKILNMYGEIERVALAETFYLNDVKGNWELIKSFLLKDGTGELMEGDFKAEQQLISFLTDKDGLVKRLYVATNNITDPIPEKKNTLFLNKKFVNARIRESEGTVNNEYIYTPDTYCFSIITQSVDKEEVVVEELSGVFAKGKGKLIEGSRPAVSVYDANQSRIAGAIVLTTPIGTVDSFYDYDRQALVVNKVEKVCDDSNEIVTRVVGFQGGKEVIFYPEDSVDVKNWCKGDVYIIYQSKNKKILKATKLFALDDTTNHVLSPAKKNYSDSYLSLRSFVNANSPANETTDWSENINGAYGTIKEIINTDALTSIRIGLEGSTKEAIYRYQPTTGVYLYHENSKKIELATMDNISIGMGKGKVFVYSRYGFARDILIIE